MTARAPSENLPQQQLTWDNEGRLTAWQDAPSSPTSTAQYLYDGEGNRVEQQATTGGTTTTTTYVGALESVATTGSTTTTTTYYYANGQRIALAVNGTLSYLASDLLGSASVALDGSGTPTASQLYAPYGGTRYTNGVMPTDYGFTGQRADSATGLDYYGARYYDPTLGQFTSADTVLDGLNRYGYVGGNPISRVDPSGHRDDEESDSYGNGGASSGNSGGGGGGGLAGFFRWLLGIGGAAGTVTVTAEVAEEEAAAGDGGVVYGTSPDDVSSDMVQTEGADGSTQYINADDPDPAPDSPGRVNWAAEQQPETIDGAPTGIDGQPEWNQRTAPQADETPESPTSSNGGGSGGRGNGGKPGATAYINQPGAQQIDGYAGEGVSNPGFDTDNHPFDGQCAEVMCASKVVTAIENGEDGWGVGKPAYIHVDQVRFKGPCPGCEDVLYQLASYLDAPVQLSFDGGPGFGTITLPPFLPGLVPFGG